MEIKNINYYEQSGIHRESTERWKTRLISQNPLLGGFAGIFPLGKVLEIFSNPCLVTACDGVGTKTLIADALGDYTTIGIDCVAAVVNDLACSNANPLFFLDYISVQQFSSDQCSQIMEGIVEGCEIADIDLIGGETAELPGLLAEDAFDLAGFGVGIVERDCLPNKKSVIVGDIIVGLMSSGIHCNGISLVRYLFPDFGNDGDFLSELIKPTIIYTPILDKLKSLGLTFKGLAHVSGGGIPGNVSRIIPDGLIARIYSENWTSPNIFNIIEKKGNINKLEMFATFNMGIGFCGIISKDEVDKIPDELDDVKLYIIGRVEESVGVGNKCIIV